ncbi:predicted protein [Botrytis cinerea T4]|uniref:Uncharacterized protein n=1 Tax=Botryotinia fuckeliana (strain T4) TaxID=999810 RepID=G2YCR1_BOTF4|nr:predicted protein [Botrytis cinerea T4]
MTSMATNPEEIILSYNPSLPFPCLFDHSRPRLRKTGSKNSMFSNLTFDTLRLAVTGETGYMNGRARNAEMRCKQLTVIGL